MCFLSYKVDCCIETQIEVEIEIERDRERKNRRCGYSDLTGQGRRGEDRDVSVQIIFINDDIEAFSLMISYIRKKYQFQYRRSSFDRQR